MLVKGTPCVNVLSFAVQVRIHIGRRMAPSAPAHGVTMPSAVTALINLDYTVPFFFHENRYHQTILSVSKKWEKTNDINDVATYSVSNQLQIDMLCNSLFTKLRYQSSELLTICKMDVPVTGGIPSQRVSIEELVPCHDAIISYRYTRSISLRLSLPEKAAAAWPRPWHVVSCCHVTFEVSAWRGVSASGLASQTVSGLHHNWKITHHNNCIIFHQILTIGMVFACQCSSVIRGLFIQNNHNSYFIAHGRDNIGKF